MKQFKEYLQESSLSRIMTHITKTENFGVMSPFRKEFSDKENLDRYKELKELVRKKGYGFIEMKGARELCMAAVAQNLYLFLILRKKKCYRWVKNMINFQ